VYTHTYIYIYIHVYIYICSYKYKYITHIHIYIYIDIYIYAALLYGKGGLLLGGGATVIYEGGLPCDRTGSVEGGGGAQNGLDGPSSRGGGHIGKRGGNPATAVRQVWRRAGAPPPDGI